MPSEKSATKNRTNLDARRDPKLDAANSKPKSARGPHFYQPSAFAASGFLEHQDDRTGRCQTGTIVRLGEALPVVFFSSAVDFILPVNCRRSTTAVRAASGTAGKMNSPEAEPRMSPRLRKRLAEAHNSPRQRHAREHVSNVQRGGG